MKIFLKILFILMLPLAGLAQRTVVKITPSMFKVNDSTFLSAKKGWLFKQGNDAAWSGVNIDTTGWKQLKPTEISAKYAGKNGRVECWFRIKIKIDSAFGDRPFYVKSISWAASDLYIDGKLVLSFGNTGNNRKPFSEYCPLSNLAVPVNLKPGHEYTIAIHFVDFLAPLPPSHLKTEDFSANQLICLAGPDYNYAYLSTFTTQENYYNIWFAVCLVLSLLFWLLYFQGPFEKTLRLIAFCVTFFSIYILAGILSQNVRSYYPVLFYIFIADCFNTLIFIIVPLIIVSIFKRRVTNGLKIFLIVFFLVSALLGFIPNNINDVIGFGLLCTLLGICVYYVVSSWKTLKGAQWAVIAGLLCSLGSFLLVIFLRLAAPQIFISNTTIYFLSETVWRLSFPLSLMVYVALRFKEIINGLQQNAKLVLQLSEEKKEEALNRQRLLEEEVNRQTAEIKTTLEHLKSTQTQLIQSEKMASLGELTAGIAHEIQNPLNFVNNFSEVNKEMLEELKAESEKPKAERDEQLEVELINDIIENEKKINHHGKRADSIVKGMLEHSRTSSGTKQPTDINKLADEYLRLSYQGLRAKDKSFNAEMLTRFYPTLPKINVVPQDIGRVFLNLFNNAFYAVNQKAKTAGADYKPTVEVETFFLPLQGVGGFRVKDNGVGIRDAIKDKIMQPFFTTKPTGEGTGLGLSLTYDMVVKGHGGSIQVTSVVGEGSEFTILLPLG